MLSTRIQESLLRGAFDSVPSHIAVVDSSGKILMVNHAWNRFTQENDGPSCGIGEGMDYLKIANGCEEGAALGKALEEALRGERDTFAETYPCHSPQEHRWFQATVNTFLHDEARYAVIRHDNITKFFETYLALQRETDELARVNAELQWLHGTIPTCSYCKRIRTDRGSWHALEGYLSRLGTSFSHGVCDECLPRVLDEFGLSNDNYIAATKKPE